jgi:hypothetical protein
MIPFTPTATPAEKPRFFRCWTSECPSCRTAHLMKRCVPRWNLTWTRATAVVSSEEVQHHVVRVAANHCLLNRRRYISRVMPPAQRKDGVGRELGKSFTASSSKTRWSRTTSDECCSSYLTPQTHGWRNIAITLIVNERYRPDSVSCSKKRTLICSIFIARASCSELVRGLDCERRARRCRTVRDYWEETGEDQ